MESNGYQTHFGYHVRLPHIFSHLFIIVSVVASWSWKWKRQVLQETRGEVELSLDWLETLWLHSGQKASILICHSRHFMSNVFKCDQMCVNCKRCVFFSVSLLELLSGYLVLRDLCVCACFERLEFAIFAFALRFAKPSGCFPIWWLGCATWRLIPAKNPLSSQLDCVSRCFFFGHLMSFNILIILIRRWGWCFRLSSRMPLWRGKSMQIRRYDVPEFLLVHLVPEDWLQLQVYAPSSFSAEMLAMRACIGNVMKQTPLAQRKDSSNMIGHAARTRRTRAARNYKMYQMYSLQIRSIQS